MTFAETEKTELKQKLTDALPKEIVAFLNTDGGTIYIGVNDNGTVSGITDLDVSLKKIADMLENQILPDARQFVELGTKFVDKKHIIEIKIHKGEGLYYIKKYGRSAQGCYMRVGSTCRSMTEEQINLIHNKYLDTKVKITEIASEIKKPTFQYLKLLLTEKGYNINDKTFAENFHLYTKDGDYNKMAELLADKNEVSIKVVRFKGKEKADGIAMRNEYGEKCLVVAMKQAFDYCADVINETRTSFRNGVRINTPLFDKEAFREVWFNACLHNNWADGTPPAIYIYTDRMEIISTGGLPANLSKDDFFNGISKPVNEELAKLFIRLDLMEQTGYGIPLVTKHYGKSVFEFMDFFLRVTIPFAFEIENEEENESTPKNDGENDGVNEPAPQNDGENDGENKSALQNDGVNDGVNKSALQNDGENEPALQNDGENDGENEPAPQNDGENDGVNNSALQNDGENDGVNNSALQNDGENDGVNKSAPQNDGENDGENEPAPQNDGENDGEKSLLSEKEKVVLSLIEQNPSIAVITMTQETGFSRPTVERAVKKLKEYNLIRRVGPDKGGHWEIINN